MTQALKIIEIVFSLEIFKGSVNHFGLFFDVTIAIFIIFKTNYNDWLVIIRCDRAIICNSSVIPDLNFEQAMLHATTSLIELLNQAVKAALRSRTTWYHNDWRHPSIIKFSNLINVFSCPTVRGNC